MANCETCKGKISIHAPRGGSDGNGVTFKNEANKFQSTLPVGGATTPCFSAVRACIISIHAPRGGSDFRERLKQTGLEISIHAPRGGSDCAN